MTRPPDDKIAHHYGFFVCDDPQCLLVHCILYNAAGGILGACSFGLEAFQLMAKCCDDIGIKMELDRGATHAAPDLKQ